MVLLNKSYSINGSNTIKEGYLHRQSTKSFHRWQKRYFKLTNRKLYCLKDEKGPIIDEIDIYKCVDAAEMSTRNMNNSFMVITVSKYFVVAAENRKTMESWIEAFKIIHYPKHPIHLSDKTVHNLNLMSQHNWIHSSHGRPTYCNVCREALTGVTFQGLTCEICKFKCHRRCVLKALNNCKWTTLSSMRNNIMEDDENALVMPHQWLEGNLPVHSKCAVCAKNCGSVLRFQDWRCLWCKLCTHERCRPQLSIVCNLGPFKMSIVQPIYVQGSLLNSMLNCNDIVENNENHNIAHDLNGDDGNSIPNTISGPNPQKVNGDKMVFGDENSEDEIFHFDPDNNVYNGQDSILLPANAAGCRKRCKSMQYTGISPLIVFINSKSGDKQGLRIIRRFKQYLNPLQVFDLLEGGPVFGLKLFRRFEPFRILICGGDGSISWVLKEIDNLNLLHKCQVGILPFGTGNDLSRVLGWGSTFDDTLSIPTIIERFERASVKMLDRWSIMVYEDDHAPELPPVTNYGIEKNPEKCIGDLPLVTYPNQPRHKNADQNIFTKLNFDSISSSNPNYYAKEDWRDVLSNINDGIRHISTLSKNLPGSLQTDWCEIATLFEQSYDLSHEQKDLSVCIKALEAKITHFLKCFTYFINIADRDETFAKGQNIKNGYINIAYHAESTIDHPEESKVAYFENNNSLATISPYSIKNNALVQHAPLTPQASNQSSSDATITNLIVHSSINQSKSLSVGAPKSPINMVKFGPPPPITCSNILTADIIDDENNMKRKKQDKPNNISFLLKPPNSSKASKQLRSFSGTSSHNYDGDASDFGEDMEDAVFELNTNKITRNTQKQGDHNFHFIEKRIENVLELIHRVQLLNCQLPEIPITSRPIPHVLIQDVSSNNAEDFLEHNESHPTLNDSVTNETNSNIIYDKENTNLLPYNYGLGRDSISSVCSSIKSFINADDNDTNKLNIPQKVKTNRSVSNTDNLVSNNKDREIRSHSLNPYQQDKFKDSQNINHSFNLESKARRTSFSSSIGKIWNKYHNPFRLSPLMGPKISGRFSPKTLRSGILYMTVQQGNIAAMLASSYDPQNGALTRTHQEHLSPNQRDMSNNLYDETSNRYSLSSMSLTPSRHSSFASEHNVPIEKGLTRRYNYQNYYLQKKLAELEKVNRSNLTEPDTTQSDGDYHVYSKSKNSLDAKQNILHPENPVSATSIKVDNIEPSGGIENRNDVISPTLLHSQQIRSASVSRKSSILSGYPGLFFNSLYRSTTPQPQTKKDERLRQRRKFSETSSTTAATTPCARDSLTRFFNLASKDFKQGSTASRTYKKGHYKCLVDDSKSDLSGTANSTSNLDIPRINYTAVNENLSSVFHGNIIGQVLMANVDALCAPALPLCNYVETYPLHIMREKCIMNNYFGIGLDAKISLDFHNKREGHPEKSSRTRNIMWYGLLGTKELLQNTFKNLEQKVQLECDGIRIPLPSLQGIVILNISSYAGGTNFWGGKKEDDIFLSPSFDDKILEVVAVFGSHQLAVSKVFNLQHHRIAQCRHVKITISCGCNSGGVQESSQNYNMVHNETLSDQKKIKAHDTQNKSSKILHHDPITCCKGGVPIQVDGEAWIQPPGCIQIVHKNRAQMLVRDKEFESILKLWNSHIALINNNPEDEINTSYTPQPASNLRSSKFHFGPPTRELRHRHSIGVSPFLSKRFSNPSVNIIEEELNALETFRTSTQLLIDTIKQAVFLDIVYKSNIQLLLNEATLHFSIVCCPNGKLNSQLPNLRNHVSEWIKAVKKLNKASINFLKTHDNFKKNHPALFGKLVSSQKIIQENVRKLQELGLCLHHSLKFHPPIIQDEERKRDASTATIEPNTKSEMVHNVYLRKNPKQWLCKDVGLWLTKELGLPSHYSDIILAHDIRGPELLLLERKDLRDLGITKIGHVKRILQAIKELKL